MVISLLYTISYDTESNDDLSLGWSLFDLDNNNAVLSEMFILQSNIERMIVFIVHSNKSIMAAMDVTWMPMFVIAVMVSMTVTAMISTVVTVVAMVTIGMCAILAMFFGAILLATSLIVSALHLQ